MSHYDSAAHGILPYLAPGAGATVREQPLLAVVGPSGMGKSSFERAGVVPALKRQS